MNADEIFLEAVEKATLAERAAFLDGACAHDPELRAKVEGLLQSHDQAGSFLQQPLFENLATVSQPLSESPGTVVGPYRLLQQIGEGGFGVVFMAEQTAPVKRKVAVKVIKPGMDSREVIARFEAERQALALMDHPNIAKVLDAGATDTGRPYFVMELVRGVPITEYCDQAQLTPRQRLELFVTVCHAVQHAHQKGIIHRDIKPTNVLVTLHDDRPVVKVIDFGVAKATSGQLTDKTLFTGFAQMIGTPLYMSPEQAALSAIDIDTRSDIYSLGVLLYELLTGTTPFDKTRMQQAAFDEVRRIIREEEPQKPSTRLSSLADTLPSVSAVRRTEPRKLSQLVRGDLDWIVMKALEKDRTRRYETANGFAADVLRYLSDETVTACPPSATYRFRKFARRNKVALATGAMVAAVLVAGIIGTTWQAIRATHEATRATNAEALAEERYEAEKTAREQADAARAAESEQRQIAQDEKQRAEENFDKARRAVDEYLSQVTESELLTVPGLQPLREDLLRAALTFYAEFTQERADDPTIQRELASAHYRLARIHAELGDDAAAAEAINEAIRLYEQLRDAGQFDREMQVSLARAYFSAVRYDDTVTLCQDVLAAEPGHAEARSLLANTWNNLGNAVDYEDVGAALTYHRQAFELRESLVRDAPENTRYLAELGGTVNNLGNLLYKQRKFAEALAMYERAVQYTQQAYEREPHSLVWGRWLGVSVINVARTQAALGQEQRALSAYERYVAVTRKRVFENPAVMSLRGDHYGALLSLGRYQQHLRMTAEAARSFREAREVLENIPRETADQLYDLATVYAALAQPDDGALEPGEDEPAERQRNIELTLQTLRQAIDAGFSDARKLRSERQFDVVRNHDGFQQLIASVETAAEVQKLLARSEESAGPTLADQQQAADLLSDVVAAQPGTVRHRRTLAATLHSIGVIQTGLRQFDEAETSLRDALKLREELLLESPTSARYLLDVLVTRAAIGRLAWDSGRHREAHLVWKDLWPQLEAFTSPQSEEDALAAGQQLNEMVRPIAETYAGLGLWEEAGPFLAATDKDGSAEMLRWDATVRLLLNDEAGYRTRCGQLAEQLPQTTDTKDLHCIAAACLMAPQGYGDLDRWIQLSEENAELQEDWTWAPFYVGLGYYRTGRFDEALNVLHSQEDWFMAWPLLAMTCQRLGDAAEAQAWLDRAHEWYLQSIHTALGGNAMVLMDGVYELDRPQFQFLYREARILLTGSAEPDPCQHLINARGYQIIGEDERAERELAASVAAAPDDAEVWLARARLLTLWNDEARPVEADWQRAIDLAGEDPLPWIHRGRWYAGRGEQEKAAADFVRAASLTPHELNKFLEAGWWIVGPYPWDLREFCPPEVDPDPSRGVRIIDPQSGLSDDPVNWESAATGPGGRVDLSSSPACHEGASVYALAHVYSPDEQTKLLMIHKDQPLRVWINGEFISDYTPEPISPFYESFHRVPVVLRSGRNDILVKANTADFMLRIGDTPRDRALWLAEQEQFAAAFAARAEMPVSERDDMSSNVAKRLLALVAFLGSDDEYIASCRAFLPSALGTHNFKAHWGSCFVALRANEIFDENAEGLAAYADELLKIRPVDWSVAQTALTHYRAGNFERSGSLLAQTSYRLHALPLQALLAHQAGDAQMAETLLQDALVLAAEHESALQQNDRLWYDYIWYDRAAGLTLLREAEQTIRGETTESDALRARCEAISQAKWAESPETAAFDQALRLSGGSIAYRLTRGRRLAELDRFDEAEVDFNLAVELSPNDAEVLTARAVFLADLGRTDEAAADFHAALNLLDQSAEQPRWQWGVPIDLAVADREEVFEQLVALRPDDPRPLMTRMAVRMQRGDFEGSRSDAERLASYEWAQPDWWQAEALWRGDRDEFDRLRAGVQRGSDPYHNILNLGLAPTEEPLTTELLQEAERMWQEQPQDRWRRRCLGLAQLRAGKYSEAVGNLEASLLTGHHWQQDSVVWPLLAVAQHHLGNSAAARHWLNVTEQWLELRNIAEFRQTGSATGVGNILPQDVLTAMASYREARVLIDGVDAADAERDLLAVRAREQSEAIRARDEDRRQRAVAKAEADWQRMIDMAGNDPAPWMRRADWYAGRGELAKAEADWQHVIEQAGDDPSLWIQRGRWYAEHGEHEKADADYAHAASLTSHELNRFLEAGWWVVGPYPWDLNEFCPPEIDPDPSRPLHVIERQSRLSDEPMRWMRAPTGAYGAVDVSAVTSGPSNNSVYSLTHVWSPEERSALLMLSKSVPLRVWVNGELIEDFMPGQFPELPDYEQFHRVPVVLRQGRNAILVKSGRAGFTLRIGDTPRDRAVLLAEQRRYTEALRALEELPFSADDLESGFLPWNLVPVLTMHDSPQEPYRQNCAAALARMADANREEWLKFRISWVCSQRSNSLFDENVDRLVALAEEFVNEHANQPPETWARPNLVLVSYRAGRYEQSFSLLTPSDLANPARFPLQALLHHQMGNAPVAESLLQAAFNAAAELAERLKTVDRSDFAETTWACWWNEWAAFLGMLAEAEQEIRGETTAADQLADDAEATQVLRWTESPELVAYDQTVLLSTRGADGRMYPQPFIARGRRLAGLGRFDAAEADFNQAVELAPSDVDVLLTRARFHADRGEFLAAEDDFDSALRSAQAAPAPSSFAFVRSVENELGRHDEVLTHWLNRSEHSHHHNWLSRVRGQRQILLEQWQAAAESLAHGEHWSHDRLLAPLYCLLDDDEAFRQICAVQLSHLPADWEEETRHYHRMEMLSLRPTTGDDADELARLLEIQWRETLNARQAPLGAALYRSGYYEEALRVLNEYVTGPDQFQCVRAWPLLAMTHWQLGHHAEARRWLNRSAWWIDLVRRAAESPNDVGLLYTDHRDWLSLNVFFREASALIEGNAELPGDTS